jgi:predicted HTH domain antitoxin
MDLKAPPMADVGDVKPVLWPAELDLMLRLGPWSTSDQLLSAALETLLAAHPTLRQNVAIELFRRQFVSLARAAEIAGTDQWGFRDILRARNVPLVVDALETATMDEVIREFTGSGV